MPNRPPRAQPQGKPAKPQPPRVRKPNAHQALYDSLEWRQGSKAYRALHPLCECDEHRGRPGAPKSECVDHVKAHRGDRSLFFDRRNWRAMAWRCHTAKTNRADGGFGNKVRTSVTMPRQNVPSGPKVSI